MNVKITAASRDLFVSLVEDAGNWSGTPLVEVSGEERGNLTQLKRAGLLVTGMSDGNLFATFTGKGKAYAQSLGLTFDDWWWTA